MTGQGMKNVYQELMKEAESVYFLKGVYGFKVSDLLKEIGYTYINKGFDVEFFYDPLFENTVEATFVKSKNVLYLQATNPSLEPILLGTRDKVISLYECLDEGRLRADGKKLETLALEAGTCHEKCFQSLSSAIKIHDKWEIETQRHMNWKGLDRQIEELMEDVFSSIRLNKTGNLTHRLLGTLTPDGARDTFQNITKGLDKRLFIKGYPGTGKSSSMKKLAKEASARGFDVQMVWCGLDSNSIDMVILPELKFCIFDSTLPHEYFPDETRKGDEIFDTAKHCKITTVEEKNIRTIVLKYREAMDHAVKYAKNYATVVREMRELIDGAIIASEWKKRTSTLLQNL